VDPNLYLKVMRDASDKAGLPLTMLYQRDNLDGIWLKLVD
jgi:hypothetical protein